MPSRNPNEIPATKRQALGQLVFCLGCCCGRTDRGMPAVPVERLKAIWKAEKLNRTIQLTVSGCLGPCDLANVVAVMSAGGTEWFGNLDCGAQYDLFVAWARRCHAAGATLPTPAALRPYRFERFAPRWGVLSGPRPNGHGGEREQPTKGHDGEWEQPQ